MPSGFPEDRPGNAPYRIGMGFGLSGDFFDGHSAKVLCGPPVAQFSGGIGTSLSVGAGASGNTGTLTRWNRFIDTSVNPELRSAQEFVAMLLPAWLRLSALLPPQKTLKPGGTSGRYWAVLGMRIDTA